MNNWNETAGQLEKTFKFRTFGEAMAFMVEASLFIEKTDHHPEWSNVYNKVHVKLTTHSAGNMVTDKDRRLAEELDKVYGKFSSAVS